MSRLTSRCVPQSDPLHCAFTLLEVLLAAALTAMVVIAGWTWLRGITYAGEHVQVHLDQRAEALALVRLMQDDLHGALGATAGPMGAALTGSNGFRCRTLAMVPGQPGSGWRDIMWQWTSSTGIVRRDGARTWTLSRNLQCTWSTDSEAPPRWWVDIAPVHAEANPIAEAASTRPMGSATPLPSLTPPPAARWTFFLGSP